MRFAAPLVAIVIALPALGLAQFGRPSVKQQISLGERAAADIRKQYKVLPDTDPRVIEVRRVAKRLIGILPTDEPWHYSFDVLDDKEVNAFALPGGPTFVFTGLIKKLDTEDELAGVMGHELTHVRLQHWAHQYEASMNRNVALNLGLILLHANSAISNLASIADTTVFDLPFTRSEEHQADNGGYEMMTMAGYNPQGMVRVFQVLQGVGGDKPPEFLSDHPSDKNRIGFLQDRIAHDPRKFPPETPLKP
jgi:predicted Zn-dependent protease